MLRTIGISRREGIGLVEVRQNLNRVLLCAEIGKNPVEMFLHIERAHFDLIAIECHQVGLHTKGASLVESPTATTGAQLTQIGDVHLAEGVQVQII